jgi:hypothetical protein
VIPIGLAIDALQCRYDCSRDASGPSILKPPQSAEKNGIENDFRERTALHSAGACDGLGSGDGVQDNMLWGAIFLSRFERRKYLSTCTVPVFNGSIPRERDGIESNKTRGNIGLVHGECNLPSNVRRR